jgi:hypothetical protein
MAKTQKPEFLHTSNTVKVSPDHQHGSKRRKRMGKVDDRIRKAEAMTEVRWKNIIAGIANGKTRLEVAKDVGLSPQSIDAYLISNVAAYKQMRDAAIVANRRSWPTELIEKVFDDLAMGMTLKAAALKNGVPADKLSNLYRIVRFDKQIREAYDDARQLQAESFLDEIIDIADDSQQDRLENGRINHEVVNRSKLKIDTRRFAMGAMVKKRFGDTKHVELEGNVTMNHIAMLTGARKRLEKVKPGSTYKTPPVIIDNETQTEVY